MPCAYPTAGSRAAYARSTRSNAACPAAVDSLRSGVRGAQAWGVGSTRGACRVAGDPAGAGVEVPPASRRLRRSALFAMAR